jgi:hypothetical protein
VVVAVKMNRQTQMAVRVVRVVVAVVDFLLAQHLLVGLVLLVRVLQVATVMQQETANHTTAVVVVVLVR